MIWKWDGRVDGGLAEPTVWVDEWADWAAADGDGGDNDGAVGAPVPFQSLNRNRSALQKPSCWRLWAKHPVGEGATPGGRSSGSGEAPDSESDSEGLHKGSRQILRK